jgi:hypothetical protein
LVAKDTWIGSNAVRLSALTESYAAVITERHSFALAKKELSPTEVRTLGTENAAIKPNTANDTNNSDKVKPFLAFNIVSVFLQLEKVCFLPFSLKFTHLNFY